MSDQTKAADHRTKEHSQHATKAVYVTSFVFGEWKRKIPVNKRAIIIAKSINYFTGHKKFKVDILGYLITRRRVCLILETKRYDIKDVFDEFKKNAAEEIKRYLQYNWYHRTDDDFDDKDLKHLRLNPFRQEAFYNDTIVRLMTGRKPDIKYYSPHIEKLKDMIHNYDFSSALNYSGALCAVDIGKKPESFWTKNLKRTKELNGLWIEYIVI